MMDETMEINEDDHKSECPNLDPQFPKHPLESCDYCNMIRACEERVRAACIAAVEKTLAEVKKEIEKNYPRLTARDGAQEAQNAVLAVLREVQP